jgi:hypothetical protein
MLTEEIRIIADDLGIVNPPPVEFKYLGFGCLGGVATRKVEEGPAQLDSVVLSAFILNKNIQVATLLHEFRHVYQLLNGQLADYCINYELDHVVWNSTKYTVDWLKYPLYPTAPWELDAIHYTQEACKRLFPYTLPNAKRSLKEIYNLSER